MPTRTRLVKVAPAQMDGQGSGGEQPGKLESQTLSQGNHESGWERQIAAVQSLCDRRESAIVRVELFGVFGVILGEALARLGATTYIW